MCWAFVRTIYAAQCSMYWSLDRYHDRHWDDPRTEESLLRGGGLQYWYVLIYCLNGSWFIGSFFLEIRFCSLCFELQKRERTGLLKSVHWERIGSNLLFESVHENRVEWTPEKRMNWFLTCCLNRFTAKWIGSNLLLESAHREMRTSCFELVVWINSWDLDRDFDIKTLTYG